jgi:hypothetical protein
MYPIVSIFLSGEFSVQINCVRPFQEVVRQRKLELQRKEEKDKERKDQAELRKKIWVEEQKR